MNGGMPVRGDDAKFREVVAETGEQEVRILQETWDSRSFADQGERLDTTHIDMGHDAIDTSSRTPPDLQMPWAGRKRQRYFWERHGLCETYELAWQSHRDRQCMYLGCHTEC